MTKKFEDLPSIISRFLKNAASIIFEWNAKLPEEIAPYIEENLQGRKNPKGFRAANTTDKLYDRTGALARALYRGQPGNISRTEMNTEKAEVDYGIDLAVIPYARVHEYGGRYIPARPYYNPGIEKWRKERLSKLQDELLAEIAKLWEQL